VLSVTVVAVRVPLARILKVDQIVNVSRDTKAMAEDAKVSDLHYLNVISNNNRR